MRKSSPAAGDRVDRTAWQGLLWCGALALAGLVPAALSAADPADQVVIKRGYVDGRFGQLHYHRAQPAGYVGGSAPIVLFHQNPKSAVEYRHLLRALGVDRVAIAFDTPGYGESDRPYRPPTMADLAGAMADGLEALGYGGPDNVRVDVFGFHTGAMIATELAVSRPDLVQRVVLSGIALRSTQERQDLLDRLPHEYEFHENGTHVLDSWFRIVIKREPGVSLESAAEIFLQDVHSLGYWWYAYRAVWSYPFAEQLTRIRQPILVLEPHEMLLEDTRRAHRDLISQATYIEMPEVTHPVRVFEIGWASYARELRQWLDHDRSSAAHGESSTTMDGGIQHAN